MCPQSLEAAAIGPPIDAVPVHQIVQKHALVVMTGIFAVNNDIFSEALAVALAIQIPFVFAIVDAGPVNSTALADNDIVRRFIIIIFFFF